MQDGDCSTLLAFMCPLGILMFSAWFSYPWFSFKQPCDVSSVSLHFYICLLCWHVLRTLGGLELQYLFNGILFSNKVMLLPTLVLQTINCLTHNQGFTLFACQNAFAILNVSVFCTTFCMSLARGAPTRNIYILRYHM